MNDRRPHEEGAALARPARPAYGKLGFAPALPSGSKSPRGRPYEASRDHAPVLALSGDMPRKMQGTDFIQTTSRSAVSRRLALYPNYLDGRRRRGRHPPSDRRRLWRSGVAHLTLPQACSAKADGAVSSVATLKPRSEFPASADDIAKMAERSTARQRWSHLRDPIHARRRLGTVASAKGDHGAGGSILCICDIVCVNGNSIAA